MYHKISEPISVLGSAVKEALTKQTLIEKLEKLSPSERKELGQALKKLTPNDIREMSKASSEVTAKLTPKLLGALTLLVALAVSSRAAPAQLGSGVADTAKSITEVVAPLLEKADMPSLSLKLAPIQDQLEQDQSGAYKVDPTVGPKKPAPKE